MFKLNKSTIDEIEHIRARASWYVGRLGDGTYAHDGIYTLLQEVLNHFVDEFREGYGTTIDVWISSKQVFIRDYGRGILLEDRYANSRLSTKAVEVTYIGWDVVNALSDYMDIEVSKNGTVDRYGYDKGVLSHKTTYKKRRKDGLSVTYSLDDSIWGRHQYDMDIVWGMLQNIAYQNVGLKINFHRHRIRSKGGMAELLKNKMKCKGYYLYPIIHFKNEWMDVAFTHSHADEEEFYSFVNGVNLRRGGTHLDALKRTVASVLIRFYSSKGYIFKDVYPGMVVAISVNVEEPIIGENNPSMLWSPSFTKDGSLLMSEYMMKFIGENLKTYLQKHKHTREMIHGKMFVAKEKRKLVQKDF